MSPRYPYVHLETTASASELVTAILFELGASGVEERDETTLSRNQGGVLLVASFDDEATALSAIEALKERGHEHARLEHVEGDDWRDAWRAYFKPTPIGERLMLRPSWETIEDAGGRVVLTLDPGRAFGSGTHETTRLVLGEVERLVRGGEDVLDVGCGSGILGIAALLLGARSVRAIDIDPDSVAVTRENAAINEVSEHLRASDESIDAIAGTFPLVLANIEAKVLIPIAPELAARVAPGGVLVLSGILVPQKDDVLAAYPGFACESAPVQGDWTAIVLRRR